MKNDEVIDVTGSIEIAEDVSKKIRNTGVRGLNMEKAKELGVFERMGNLLSMIHTCMLASFSMYDDVDLLLDKTLGAKKHEIKCEMNKMEGAYMRFVNFWTTFYNKAEVQSTINDNVETLYHNIFRWMQVPERWELGGEQRTDEETTTALTFVDSVEPNNKTYTFNVASVGNEITECEEAWCVLKFDKETITQTSVETGMDKASALMVAKRLSSNDPEGIYSVALVRDITEKRTDITPFKVFQNNKTIGTIVKTLKK